MRISEETFILKRNRNYTYHKKFPFLLERKRNHIEYYRCIQRYASKCKARLVIKRFQHGKEQTVQLKEHNHEPSKGTFNITYSSNCLEVKLLLIWFDFFLYQFDFRQQTRSSHSAQRLFVFQTLQNRWKDLLALYTIDWTSQTMLSSTCHRHRCHWQSHWKRTTRTWQTISSKMKNTLQISLVRD